MYIYIKYTWVMYNSVVHPRNSSGIKATRDIEYTSSRRITRDWYWISIWNEPEEGKIGRSHSTTNTHKHNHSYADHRLRRKYAIHEHRIGWPTDRPTDRLRVKQSKRKPSNNLTEMWKNVRMRFDCIRLDRIITSSHHHITIRILMRINF